MKRKFHVQVVFASVSPSSPARCRTKTGSMRRLLKRLHDRQDHDEDHQDRRHLIDNSIKFCGMAVSVMIEITHPAHHESVQSRKNEGEKDLRLQPGRTEPVAFPT